MVGRLANIVTRFSKEVMGEGGRKWKAGRRKRRSLEEKEECGGEREGVWRRTGKSVEEKEKECGGEREGVWRQAGGIAFWLRFGRNYV